MPGVRYHLALLFLASHYVTCDLKSNEVFEAIKSDDTTALKRILTDPNLSSFINQKDEESGQTPVMMSVLRGRTEMVRLLLAEEEVDVTIGEMQGYTVMHGAGFQGRAEILRLLLKDKRNIDPSHIHSDGFSPLHRACWGNEPRHTETVKVFVEEAGVPWNLKSKKGTTCYDVTGNSDTRNFLKKIKKQEKKKEL